MDDVASVAEFNRQQQLVNIFLNIVCIQPVWSFLKDLQQILFEIFKN